MKISEALRAGALGRVQCSFGLLGPGGECCALGAIGYGLGLTKAEITIWKLGKIFPALKSAPGFGIHEAIEDEADSLQDQIMALNDWRDLSFDEIASCLENKGF